MFIPKETSVGPTACSFIPQSFNGPGIIYALEGQRCVKHIN